MYASTVFATIIAVAMAVPTNWGGDDQKASASVGDVCGNGNTVHCCDAETANKAVGGLLGNLDLSNLLGACNDITATIIGAAVPIKNTCSMQAVCCGEQKQNVSDLIRQLPATFTNADDTGPCQPWLHSHQPLSDQRLHRGFFPRCTVGYKSGSMRNRSEMAYIHLSWDIIIYT